MFFTIKNNQGEICVLNSDKISTIRILGDEFKIYLDDGTLQLIVKAKDKSQWDQIFSFLKETLEIKQQEIGLGDSLHGH